jgi:hypothetical protein
MEHREKTMAEAHERGEEYKKWARMRWDFVENYEDPTRWREMSAADEKGELYELPPPPEVRIRRSSIVTLT